MKPDLGRRSATAAARARRHVRVRPWPEIQRRSRLDAVLDERFSRLERCVLVQNGERLGLDSKLARGLAAYLQRKGRGRAVSCRVWWAGAKMRLS